MSRSLRILLFGYDRAGVAALAGLRHSGHQVCACFTHATPQAAQEWIPSLSDACKRAGVPTSESALEPSASQPFRDERPDLIVSAGYRRRITLPFLALPRWGAINVHMGPLPRYRGGAPIPWGILNGESSWAVTVHAMTHNYNEGGLLRQQPISLRDTDNAYDLFDRCSTAAAQAVVETVNEIAPGSGDLVAQDLRDVRFYDAAVPFGGRIDWNQPATCLAAFVRALDFGRGEIDGPYHHLTPPAAATLCETEIGIWRARAGGTMSPYPPGTITRTDDEVWVQTGRGHLVLDRICDPQGHDFAAADYFAANGIEPGQSFNPRHAWRAPDSLKLGHAA